MQAEGRGSRQFGGRLLALLSQLARLNEEVGELARESTTALAKSH